MGERREQRRRLADLKRRREAMLLDLGALVYELHRQGRRAPELLQSKAAELTLVDDELRVLEDSLEGYLPPAQEEPGARTEEVEEVWEEERAQ